MDDWTEMVDKGQPFDVVYLDFRKAFDTVPHKRLLKKLTANGVDEPLVSWIGHLLEKRSQRVVVNGAFSDWKGVTSGISQGSVLGPLLFLIYINDLPDVIDCLNALFADDTKVYSPVQTIDDARALQNNLNNLDEWSDKWQLSFNVSKCKVVHFGNGNHESMNIP